MTTIYTADGSTVTRTFRTAPERHWVQDDAESGHYVEATPAVGYYELVEVPRPSPDHVRSVTRDGDTFVEVWTFDQATADANAAAEAEQAERDVVKNFVGQLDNYLALTTPTNAQVVAQVDRLTRAVKRLIKDQYGTA